MENEITTIDYTSQLNDIYLRLEDIVSQLEGLMQWFGTMYTVCVTLLIVVLAAIVFFALYKAVSNFIEF